MGVKAANLELLQDPLPCYRDVRTVVIGADDFELPGGFVAQVASAVAAQSITYRTLGGSIDRTEAGIMQGDDVAAGPGGTQAALVAIRGASTITSVVIGVF